MKRRGGDKLIERSKNLERLRKKEGSPVFSKNFFDLVLPKDLSLIVLINFRTFVKATIPKSII